MREAGRVTAVMEIQVSDLLKALGVLGFLAGAYFVFTGYASGIYVTTDGGDVVPNLGLASERSDRIAFGGALLIAGSVLLIGGYVGDRLDNVAKRLGRTPIEREEADA